MGSGGTLWLNRDEGRIKWVMREISTLHGLHTQKSFNLRPPRQNQPLNWTKERRNEWINNLQTPPSNELILFHFFTIMGECTPISSEDLCRRASLHLSTRKSFFRRVAEWKSGNDRKGGRSFLFSISIHKSSSASQSGKWSVGDTRTISLEFVSPLFLAETINNSRIARSGCQKSWRVTLCHLFVFLLLLSSWKISTNTQPGEEKTGQESSGSNAHPSKNSRISTRGGGWGSCICMNICRPWWATCTSSLIKLLLP